MSDRAIVLAAGEGSRLRPFTADKPKPMVRALNKPILQHSIEALVANRIREITLVVGYHRERVQSYFGDGQRFGVSIKYAFQDTLRGTANALATARRPAGSYLVLGGDNVVDADLISAALSVPDDRNGVVVHRSERPHRYGVVALDGPRLREIVEKPENPRSEWVNTGVYKLTPELHDQAVTLSNAGAVGIPDLLQWALHEGREIQAVRTEALWSDAVYPWDLLRVHADLLYARKPEPSAIDGVTVEPPSLVSRDATVGRGTIIGAGTCIGHNVAIGPNCVIENCVIYDDVQISSGSILRNSIIGAGTRIGPRFTTLSGPCDVHLADGWHPLDDFGAILGEDITIGGAVTTLPGVAIGNQTRVGHVRTVSGTIPDRSHVL